MESRDHHGKQVQDRPDQGNFDFDVRPAGPYAGQRPDYQPRKGGGGLGRIWVGIVVVAVILGLTWYAFRTEPATEVLQETLPATTPEDFTPRAPEGIQAEREGDMAFAPVQDELGGVASTETSATSGDSSEPTVIGAFGNQGPETQAASAGTDGNRPSAASTAPVPKPVESQSAAASSSVTENQIVTSQTGDRSAAPAPEPAESQSTAASDQQAAVGSSTSVLSTVDISDFWVINISSTPDEEESKRLLKRIDGQDLGGQMYFYQATVNGRLQHRIRVGFFGTKAEAEAAGEKIKADFNLVATPWAVQPTVNEVEKYKKD